jgi:hypothetical protein
MWPRPRATTSCALLENFFENFANFKKTKRRQPLPPRLRSLEEAVGVPGYARWLSFGLAERREPAGARPTALSLRAYRRITLDNAASKAFDSYRPAVNRPNGLQRMLKSIMDARDVLENSRDVVSAVGGDLDHALFEPIRQVSLFLKDALAVPLAFADLPVQVLNNCQTAVVQYISTKQAFEGFSDSFANQTQRVVDAYKALADLGAATSKVNTAAGKLGVARNGFETDAALSVFAHPEDYYDLFKQVEPGQIDLPLPLSPPSRQSAMPRRH